MMDGNTYEKFNTIEIPVEQNMYHQLKKYKGLQNFQLKEGHQDSSDFCNEVVDKRPDQPRELAASVNKIRGIETVQLQKVGEYQLDRIDYIISNPKEFTMSDVTLPVFDRSPDKRNSKDSP